MTAPQGQHAHHGPEQPEQPEPPQPPEPAEPVEPVEPPAYGGAAAQVAPTVAPADAVKQVIVVRRDLKMRRGKEIAQGAHASNAWLTTLVTAALDPASRSARVTVDPVSYVWMTTSWRKVTLQAHSEEELVALHDAAVARGLHSHLVRDSGKTEFGGVPTLTALAIGPGLADLIDEVTGHLTIY